MFDYCVEEMFQVSVTFASKNVSSSPRVAQHLSSPSGTAPFTKPRRSRTATFQLWCGCSFFLLWSGLCQAKSVYVCVGWELLGTHVVPFDQTADLV